MARDYKDFLNKKDIYMGSSQIQELIDSHAMVFGVLINKKTKDLTLSINSAGGQPDRVQRAKIMAHCDSILDILKEL